MNSKHLPSLEPRPADGAAASFLQRLRPVWLLVGLCLSPVVSADPTHATLITRIDIDRNGTPDFEYRGGQVVGASCTPFNPGFTVTGFGLIALNGNQVLRSDLGCYPQMASLSAGSMPETSPLAPLNWGVMGELLVHNWHGLLGPYYFGPFSEATNGYATVRFSSPAGLHYGWIQFTSTAPNLPPTVARFAAEPRVNTPLEIGRLLSDTSPSDASWVVPTAPLLILDQVESAGTSVRASGPLAGRSAVVLGIGNATGDHWWIEVAANGDNRFVGHSHTNQGRLVVGQPSMNSQWASAAIDLDGDHRMDFSYQAIAPGTVNAEHWLHPFSNHRILVPLRTPRVGTLVGPTAAAGSWWTNAPVLLWREGGSPDPIAEGTNGHVAVEFAA